MLDLMQLGGNSIRGVTGWLARGLVVLASLCGAVRSAAASPRLVIVDGTDAPLLHQAL